MGDPFGIGSNLIGIIIKQDPVWVHCEIVVEIKRLAPEPSSVGKGIPEHDVLFLFQLFPAISLEELT